MDLTRRTVAIMGSALLRRLHGGLHDARGVQGAAKGTFFGEHAFIHIWDIVMITLMMAGVVGVYLHQAGRLDKSGKAGFYLTLMGFGLCVVGGCRS